MKRVVLWQFGTAKLIGRPVVTQSLETAFSPGSRRVLEKMGNLYKILQETFQGHVLHFIHRFKAVLHADLCHLCTRIIFIGLFRQSSFAMQSALELWP